MEDYKRIIREDIMIGGLGTEVSDLFMIYKNMDYHGDNTYLEILFDILCLNRNTIPFCKNMFTKFKNNLINPISKLLVKQKNMMYRISCNNKEFKSECFNIKKILKIFTAFGTLSMSVDDMNHEFESDDIFSQKAVENLTNIYKKIFSEDEALINIGYLNSYSGHIIFPVNMNEDKKTYEENGRNSDAQTEFADMYNFGISILEKHLLEINSMEETENDMKEFANLNQMHVSRKIGKYDESDIITIKYINKEGKTLLKLKIFDYIESISIT